MFFYATLNENNICTGISQLSGEVMDAKLVAINTLDTDKLWRKYENGQWSAEKFEPASTAPIDEFTALKATVDQLVLDSLK